MSSIRIFHITHIDNLPSIIASGGLWCDNKKVKATNIAHSHIKQRRANVQVPIASRGTVDQYVPFYFAPRSPMLYAIHTGSVQGYSGGQNNIVHLETTIDFILALNLPFVFTDGGADSGRCTFSNDISQLPQILDYVTEAFTFWFDNEQHPDRTHKRNAEFLVYNFVPWKAIRKIGVISSEIQQKTLSLISQVSVQPELVVESRWYY